MAFIREKQIAAWDAEQMRVGLACAISIVAMFFRSYDRLFDPQLWAEDGPQFLANAYNEPGLSGLFDPYAGYFHLIPRLIAEFATHFSLYAVPYIFTWSAFFIACLVILFVALRDVAVEYKLASFIVIPLSFGSPELFLSPTNVHWFLGVYVVSLLAGNLAKRDFITIPFVALTGPFAFLAVFALLASFALEQLGRIRFGRVQITERTVLVTGLVCWLVLASCFPDIGNIEEKIVVGLRSYVNFSTSQLLQSLFVVAVIICPLIAWNSLNRFDKRVYFFFLMYWLSVGYKFGPTPVQPFIGGGGGRYFFIPEVLILYGVLRAVLSMPVLERLRSEYVYSFFFFLFLAAQLRYTTLETYYGSYKETWVPQVRAFYNCESDRLMIQPQGWAVVLHHECGGQAVDAQTQN